MHPRLIAVCTVAVLSMVAACSSGGNSKSSSSATTTSKAAPGSGRVTDLKLDPKHDYGNKYANGILPVGDNKYVTDAPKKGSVFLCRTPQGQAGGAQERGPWFVNNNTEYDINKKVAVEGTVGWNGTYSETVSGSNRVITTNDLPRDHTTGVFPIHQIAPQSLTYTLNAAPTVAAKSSCVGGEVGVMMTGVALFDAFDAGGRDAGAWEVQDGCNGHPQISSEYHYHTLSSCIQDATVTNVIGFALDGFPITGPKVGDNNILTTSDLDECHGITSTITLDGQQVETYHYVMTQDFPYSASCFRSTAAQPPGQPAGPPGPSGGPPR